MRPPLATLTASPPRRVLAAGMLLGLGALMLWLAAAEAGMGAAWRLYLAVLGVLATAGAARLWRVTGIPILLHEDGIYDGTGRLLCRLDDVRAVERGVFAFKPSNGFLIRLAAPAPRAWAPGMWWRFGTRLGVGGVTGAAPARYMAELVALRLSGADWPPERPGG